jgi:hypothetical protein
MSKPIKALSVSLAVVAALAVASTLSAHDSRQFGSTMMGLGMVEQGGMMGMMGTDCQGMMLSMNCGGRDKPNEPWRTSAPGAG